MSLRWGNQPITYFKEFPVSQTDSNTERLEYFAFNLFTNQIDYLGTAPAGDPPPNTFKPSVHLVVATREQMDMMANNSTDLAIANSRTQTAYTVKAAGFGYQTYHPNGEPVAPPVVDATPAHVAHPKDYEYYLRNNVVPSTQHRLVEECIELLRRLPNTMVIGTDTQHVGKGDEEIFHHSIDLIVNESSFRQISSMAMQTVRYANVSVGSDLVNGRRIRWVDNPGAGTIVVTPALIGRTDDMFFHGSSLSVTVLRLVFLPDEHGKDAMLNAFIDEITNNMVDMGLEAVPLGD